MSNLGTPRRALDAALNAAAQVGGGGIRQAGLGSVGGGVAVGSYNPLVPSAQGGGFQGHHGFGKDASAQVITTATLASQSPPPPAVMQVGEAPVPLPRDRFGKFRTPGPDVSTPVVPFPLVANGNVTVEPIEGFLPQMPIPPKKITVPPTAGTESSDDHFP